MSGLTGSNLLLSRLLKHGGPRGGGGGGIAFIASASAGNTSGTSGCTTTGIDTTGATLLVAAIQYLNGSAPVLSDSKTNSWTALTAAVGGPTCRLYYTVPSSVGSGHTFSIGSGVNAFASLEVMAFSGTHATPFDTQATGTGTSTAPSAGTGFTPSLDNELVVAAVGANNAAISAISGGFTIKETLAHVANQHYAGSIAYLIQTTAAAADPDWTLGSSVAWGATLACFKAA